MKSTLYTGLLLLLLGVSSRAAATEEKVYASHLMVDQEVVVAARITGIVESIAVDRGSVVTQGQVLATLDPREFDADLRQAKEDMDLKKAEFDRSQVLAESKISSAQDLDEKRAQYRVAVAAWEKAKAIRDYAIVRAPFNGVVTEKYARVGEKVIDDQSVPLFKVTAVEPLLARLYLPEEELLRVKVGDKVEVVPDKFPDARTTGDVQFISPAIDAASGTFQVIIRVRREPAKTVLRPGLSVKVRFIKPGPK